MDSLSEGSLLQSGKYKIIKTLGQGGFGITYLAEQVALGRKVAIKEFFMKDYCDRDGGTSHVSVPTENSRNLVDSFKKKLVKEAQVIASLRNPHIVSIHDIFEENGTAYYVMERLPGGSLADFIIRSGRLTEEWAIKYIRQIASALQYIHEHNTMHLDVKPSNILLDSQGNAVLIDFGTSKHYDSIGEQTTTTPIGYSKGYAPLEQYRAGDVSQFKPATDIYALGATLYYLVTGEVPPEASVVLTEGLSRVDGVSDIIWNTIIKAMKPIWKDRPQSIIEFLQQLDEESTIVNPPRGGNGKKDSYSILTNDGRVRVYTEHGKSWLAIDGKRLSDYYDEVNSNTLVDDCLVCTKRYGKYGYTYIDVDHQRVNSTPHKYSFATVLSGVLNYYRDTPINEIINSQIDYDVIIDNGTEESKVLLMLKKYSGYYIIDEQGFKYFPKTSDDNEFWGDLIGLTLGFLIVGLFAASLFHFDLWIGAVSGFVLGIIGSVVQKKDCVKPSRVKAFGPLKTVLDTEQPNKKTNTQKTQAQKEAEVLPDNLLNTTADVYLKSKAPHCDVQTVLSCPKTGAKNYYRIEREGGVGMRHILKDGRIQELFPFDGEDDIDFDDAWFRLRPNEQ